MEKTLKTVSAMQITRMISDLSGLPVAMFDLRAMPDGLFEAKIASDLTRTETAQANLDEICRRLREHYRIK